MRQIVVDTNVLISGLRSNAGASYQLLERVGARGAGFKINLSVPLVLEYEMALSRDEKIAKLAGHFDPETTTLTLKRFGRQPINPIRFRANFTVTGAERWEERD